MYDLWSLILHKPFQCYLELLRKSKAEIQAKTTCSSACYTGVMSSPHHAMSGSNKALGKDRILGEVPMQVSPIGPPLSYRTPILSLQGHKRSSSSFGFIIQSLVKIILKK